ncbi:NAD(P)-binding protein [Trichoderma citrinoviride]|uniref:NAD(P)-binding protein n=1 Tax=Trichoderma citrinoviride TaxID=58853 RepID=A0A2T4B033_9HYPO|nr:NAD(P)-binding protein [Trichoderma citrinoviride]PTB62676.1 NAD(P)-binding protein [Trichoderma citrinoviride]
MSTILVTGGSGFVASHLILKLLNDGHTIRATLRSLSKEQYVRSALQKAGAVNLDRLSFHATDLTEDRGWAEAIQGCSFVHHVASPLPAQEVKDENDLIVPAREGTLRVLKAARDAHVKRVIFTSSFAAIGFGYKDRQEPFTEADWSLLDGLPAYHKSKALAEKAAWEFIEAEGGDLELSVINPVGIFGPILGNDMSASIDLIKKLMDGSISRCPKTYFNVVDVRDLADLHIQAMLDPAAKNERFIASCDGKPLALIDVARIISQGRAERAKKVPTAELPSWVVRLAAIFSPAARQMVPVLDVIRPLNNEKAKKVLGWTPRSVRDTIIDTVDSLVDHGMV